MAIFLRLNLLELFEIILLLRHITKVSSTSHKRLVPDPAFLHTPRKVTVHKNEMAELQCRIKNLGPKQVAWRKVSMDYPLTVGVVPFDPREDISVNYKELEHEKISQWDLVIKHAQPRHSGMYECQISAQILYAHYVYLKVLDTPLVVKPAISVTGTTFVNIHQTIRLVCNASGGRTAPSVIDWFFNGHVVRGHQSIFGPRLHIHSYVKGDPGRVRVSILTVTDSMFSDKGKYVCRSSVNNDYQTANLNVSVLNRKDVEKREESKTHYSTSGKNPDNSGNMPLSSVITAFGVLVAIFTVAF